MSQESGFTGFQSQMKLTGQLDHRRSFDSGDLPATFAQAACAKDYSDAHVASLYSFVLTAARCDAIIAGTYDARFRSFWRSKPPGAVLLFGAGHEGDAKVRNGVYTAAQWAGAQQRMASVLAGERAKTGTARIPGLDDIYFQTILTLYYFTAGPTIIADGRVGGGMDVGFIAGDYCIVDQYGHGTDDPVLPQANYDSFMAGYPDKLRGIGEFSTQTSQRATTSNPGGGKGGWIKALCAAAFSKGYSLVTGFDSSTNGSEPFLQGEGLPAWRASMALYQGTSPVVVPPGTGGGGGTTPPPGPVSGGTAGTYLSVRT